MMTDFVNNSMAFGIVISVIGYEFGVFLKNKVKHPILKALLNPLLIGIIFVCSFLVAFNIEYDSYFTSAKYLSFFLTPATIVLAIPLYEKIQLLKDNFLAIIVGICSGALASLVSIYIMSVLFKLDHAEYVTLLPKSITTAIGMGISDELGGYTTITISAIMVTGVFGSIFAEVICKLARITNPIAKGIAIGTASHAIGTTKAMEIGEVEGAMSSLSIVICGLSTLIFVSFFVNLI